MSTTDETTTTTTTTESTETDDSTSTSDEEREQLEALEPDARRLVERANSQAAARRREARAEREARERAEGELAEFRRSAESEQERVVREAEERGFARAAPIVLEAVFAVAAAGRMRDPEDAARLVDESVREELLTLDAEGRRRRATEAIDELLEARPYLALNGDESTSTRGTLVSHGARSSTRRQEGGTPDEWLRDEARRR